MQRSVFGVSPRSWIEGSCGREPQRVGRAPVKAPPHVKLLVKCVTAVHFKPLLYTISLPTLHVVQNLSYEEVESR